MEHKFKVPRAKVVPISFIPLLLFLPDRLRHDPDLAGQRLRDELGEPVLPDERQGHGQRDPRVRLQPVHQGHRRQEGHPEEAHRGHPGTKKKNFYYENISNHEVIDWNFCCLSVI